MHPVVIPAQPVPMGDVGKLVQVNVNPEGKGTWVVNDWGKMYWVALPWLFRMQMVANAFDCPCWTSPIAKTVTAVVVQVSVGMSPVTTTIPGCEVTFTVDGTMYDERTTALTMATIADSPSMVAIARLVMLMVRDIFLRKWYSGFTAYSTSSPGYPGIDGDSEVVTWALPSTA
jgi:hypothetical protein